MPSANSYWQLLTCTEIVSLFRHERTSLVVALPMTTAAYNADNPFAVPVGQVGGRKAGQTSYVLCHQPKSFDWRLCGGAPHPMKKISDARFAEALTILNQIVQLA